MFKYIFFIIFFVVFNISFHKTIIVFSSNVTSFETISEVVYADNTIAANILSFCMLNVCSSVKYFHTFTKHLCVYHEIYLSYESFDPCFYITKKTINGQLKHMATDLLHYTYNKNISSNLFGILESRLHIFFNFYKQLIRKTGFNKFLHIIFLFICV